MIFHSKMRTTGQNVFLTSAHVKVLQNPDFLSPINHSMAQVLVGDPDCSFQEIALIFDIPSISTLKISWWTSLATILEIPLEYVYYWQQELIYNRQTHSGVIVALLTQWRMRKSIDATLGALHRAIPDAQKQLKDYLYDKITEKEKCWSVYSQNLVILNLDEEEDSEEEEYCHVFRGTYGLRPVVVKKKRTKTKTGQEQLSALVKILTLVDSHVNILRYFKSELKCNPARVLLVFEQCDTDLQSVLGSSQKPETLPISIRSNKISILRQIAKGMSYVNSHKILHLNLRPTNVLLTNIVAGEVVAKISNFANARHLSQECVKPVSCSVSAKTIKKCLEWLPREILVDIKSLEINESRPISVFQSTDAFSVGCIFYYVLKNGQHPYGDRLFRTAHILTPEYIVERLDDNLFEGYCGECGNDLIDQLLTTNYKQRIIPAKIEHHPFFYSISSLDVKCKHVTTSYCLPKKRKASQKL